MSRIVSPVFASVLLSLTFGACSTAAPPAVRPATDPAGVTTSVPPVHASGALAIPQTYRADLDAGRLSSDSQADLWFRARSATERDLVPQGGARIALIGQDPPGYHGCASAGFSTQPIQMSQLRAGTYLCVRTEGGRLSQVRVSDPVGPSPGELLVTYVIWDSGSALAGQPGPGAEPSMQTIQICVITNGMLRHLQAQYNPLTGDTTVANQAFSRAHPVTSPPYAVSARWFIANEPITFQSRRYVKFRGPRVMGAGDLSRAGEYQGVTVFVEAGAPARPEVIFLPVRPGCEFQPYQFEVRAGT
jgi:hypothetical protein